MLKQRGMSTVCFLMKRGSSNASIVLVLNMSVNFNVNMNERNVTYTIML